jgi:hypothetical protein
MTTHNPGVPDEVALDEAALLAGSLFEVHDEHMGRVLAVRDTLTSAIAAAGHLAARLVEETQAQLAANGEGHPGLLPITLTVRDADTGAPLVTRTARTRPVPTHHDT